MSLVKQATMGQGNMTLWDWLVFIKGGIEFSFVLLYCFVLWARDIVLLAFPERKSFRGDVILITGEGVRVSKPWMVSCSS
jgi:hypothetical protein